MRTMTLEAPAKINLTLDILGCRTDGYHDLRMVMQSVSLGDTVTVTETAGGFSLLAEGFTPPAGKTTLEQAGGRGLFPPSGPIPCPGLEVRLIKRVPAYAGLGGGSADAAAVLRCLRALYAPELPRETPGGDRPDGGQRRALLRPGAAPVWRRAGERSSRTCLLCRTAR